MGEVIEFKRKKDKDIEDIYIDQIHEYYLNNANIYGYNLLDEDTFTNIDSIVIIKQFNKELKNKYIKIVKDLNQLDESIISKIILVANLTQLYLYLDDNVENYDISSLKNILAYRIVNKVDIEDAVSIYDDSNRKRM